jgi:heme O synthase-like polyprenyltransferase
MSPHPGRSLVQASWTATVALVVAAAAGVLAIDTFAPVVVWLSAIMFVAGCVLFFMAYARAVARSRTDAIGIGGLYFLSGSAPAPVRRHLMGSFAVQCVVVVVVIALRPFTSLVLSSLAPMFGLGCAGVWGARYGTFAPRRRARSECDEDPPRGG